LVDRYGPRLPLTIGPAITGLGFFVLSLPGLTGGVPEYWTTYFPGIVIIGVGMGVTVAPLTTAVMGSVASDHAGVASGINNAVARSAGVLAIAIFGAVALIAFGSQLEARTSSLELPEEARSALRLEAANLAAAEAPAGLAPQTQATVEENIKLAFVDTFRLVMLIAAGLAWLSAVLAALTVEGQTLLAGKAKSVAT
jgi:MFS family permease